jgi:5-methylcytosine-specific restriction protein B
MTFEPNEKLKELLELLRSGRFSSERRSETAKYREFISQFPSESLLTLTLDQYCVGKQLPSFCKWIERDLEPVFGRYVPGTSRGHILYFSQKHDSYWKKPKLADLTDEEALRYTLKIQYAIATANISEDISWIDDDEQLYAHAGVERRVTMSAGRKLRILCCYNPDQFLPITSSPHLKHFLELFGCPKKLMPKVGQPVARSMLLRELFLNIQNVMPTISPRDFVDALYNKDSGFAPSDVETEAAVEGRNEDEFVAREPAVNDDTELPMEMNTILYGPPGTGKTFSTIDEAIKILAPEFYADNEDERDTIKELFDDFVATKRIRFVTFHQSFSYEDFVEGLRANLDDSEGDQIQYEIAPGVFKLICDEARKSIQSPSAEVRLSESPRIWKISIGGTGEPETRQHCFTHGEARIGWGQVGDLKTAQLNNPAFDLGPNDRNTLESFANDIAVGDVLLCIGSNTEVSAIGIVNGTYRFDETPPVAIKAGYKHVLPVSWIATNIKFSILNLNGQKRFTQKTVYELKRFSWSELFDGLRAAKVDVDAIGATTTNSDPFVLIIDEINRGNVSRIFGELITLIEPSKRLGESESLTVTLPYSKKPFGVPNNVFLIGTMNTADKSLASLDIALRRRFVFKEMPVRYELLNTLVIDEKLNLGHMLQAMNQRIKILLDRDHCIGHAYFLSLKSDAQRGSKNSLDSHSKLNRLSAIFKQKILPLLQEYFFDDWERIGWVLNDQRTSCEPFIKLDDSSATSVERLFGAEFVDKLKLRETRWSVNELALTSLESYCNIAGAAE